MPNILRFLFDEHLRGPLWRAVQPENLGSPFPIDPVRVGDVSDLPLGSADADVLAWAAVEDRIVVTRDANTMAGIMKERTASGLRSAGIVLIRPRQQVTALIEVLQLVAHAGNPADFADAVSYIP